MFTEKLVTIIEGFLSNVFKLQPQAVAILKDGRQVNVPVKR